MRKTSTLISIMLICSMLLSAMSPVLQEPQPVLAENPVVEEIGQPQENTNEGNDENIQTVDPVVPDIPVSESPAQDMPQQDISGGDNSGSDSPVQSVIPAENIVPETNQDADNNIAENQNTEQTNNVVEDDQASVQTSLNGPDAEGNDNGSNEDLPLQQNETPDPTIEENNDVRPADDQGEAAGSDEENISDAAILPVLNVVEVAHVQNEPVFRVVISNMGNVKFSDVTVKFKKPSYTLNGASESVQTSGSISAVNNLPVSVEGDEYIIGELEHGGIVEIVYSVDIPEGFSNALVSSSAEVSGKYETITDEGTAMETITSSSSADSYILGENPHYAELGVTLVDSKDGFYFPGESILHQVVITNESEFDMDNVFVSYEGLSASGYEDIPCVFTSVCDTNGCSPIASDEQDSTHRLSNLDAASSVLMFCENGVNNVYSESVSYVGRVNVTANVLSNDQYAPANSTIERTSNNTYVEIMLPLSLSSAPVHMQSIEPVLPDEVIEESNDMEDKEIISTDLENEIEKEADEGIETEPNLRSLSAPRMMNAQSAPLLGASNSRLILRADCVNAQCIGNTDTTKSFYVSACNDGETSYNSVTLSSSQAGSFKRYFRVGLNQYSAGGGYSENNPVSASGTSVNTGALAGNTCVIAVFEATFNDPPQDHTKSKTFSFGVNADGQTGTVNVSVDGCYVPEVNPNIGVTVNPITQCVSPSAASNEFTLRVNNTGDTDLCGIEVKANKPGYFTYRSTQSSSNTYTHSGTLYAEDFITLKFVENLSGVTLGEGTTHSVAFNVTGYQCSATSKKVSASGQGSFNVCVEPKPSISITPTAKTSCVDVNATDTATFTIKNDGGVAFCRLDLEFRIIKNGSVVGTQTKTINNLAVNATQTVNLTFTPASFGIKEGDTYEVHMVTNAYTASNGSCTVKAKADIDRKVDETACKSGLTVTQTAVSECVNINSSKELTFTLKNTGQVDFCKLDGEFQVKKGGTVVGRQAVNISTGLAKGASTTAKYTLNAKSLGLAEGDSYEVHLVINGYTSVNGACTAKPQSGIDKKIDLTNCKSGLTVTPTAVVECTDVNSPKELTFTLKNDGQIDFCKLDGEFQVKKGSTVVGRQAVNISAGLAKGASTTAKYTLNAKSLGLSEGDSYEVHLVINGYTSANGACTAKQVSGIDKKIDLTNCKTGLTVTPPVVAECTDVNSSKELTFTLKNDGQIDFCKLDGEFQVKKGNTVVGRQAVNIAAGLAKGASTTAKYTLNAKSLGLAEGDSYEVHLVINGYTSVSGSCIAKPQSGIDKKVDLTNCKTGLTITPPVKGTCTDPNVPDEYTFTVKNTGELDMCKLDGEFQVIRGGNIIARESVTQPGLAKGMITNLKYSVNGSSIGLNEKDSYTVKLVLNGYTGTSSSCQTKIQSNISAEANNEVCETPKEPGIEINVEGECHEEDQPETYEFNVVNTGEVEFCRIDGTVSVLVDGQTVTENDINLDQKVRPNGSVKISYTINASDLNLGNKTYEVKLVINGYVEENGQCNEKAIEAEKSVESEICPHPDLNVNMDITACFDPKKTDPIVLDFNVQNTGNQEFCWIDVIGPEGSIINNAYQIGYTNNYHIARYFTQDDNPRLAVGQTGTAAFTFVPETTPTGPFTVDFTVNAYSNCGHGAPGTSPITGATLTTKTLSVDVEICPELQPEIKIDVEPEGTCTDPESDTKDDFDITVTNPGDTDFCDAVVTGPEGSIIDFANNPVGNTSNVLHIGKLEKNATVLLTAAYKPENITGSYSALFKVSGYLSVDGETCDTNPAAEDDDIAEMDLCPEIPNPDITVDINTDDECHKPEDGPDNFEYVIENTGDNDLCKVIATLSIVFEGRELDTFTLEFPKLEVGEKIHGVHTVEPELYGLSAEDVYEVQIAVDGYTGTDEDCGTEPVVSDLDTADKMLCEDIPVILQLVNMNPECINAGDTLKFKGEIDIPEGTFAKYIDVETGNINWGGSDYSCKITSVKTNSADGYVEIPEDAQDVRYSFEVKGHGAGAVGFICEAKTNPKEQMRNSKQLKFNAKAIVSTDNSEYEITSNQIVASQKCPYTRIVNLPHTGDDTNLPLLIGMVSLFAITGAFTSVSIVKKNKKKSDNTENN